jgi:hypothetical protein
MLTIAAVIGIAFGAGDQYLGSLAGLPWATSSSLLSAPWLVLPFLVGCTQTSTRRAALIGLIATAAALLGYTVMGLTPLEGAHLSEATLVAVIRSEGKWLIAGAFSGPVYGILGQRWRVKRSWLAAVLVPGALCFEPAAEAVLGNLRAPAIVWIVEVALGAVAAGYFLASRTALRTLGKRSG